MLHYIAGLRQTNHSLELANAAAKKQASSHAENLTKQGFYSAPKEISPEHRDKPPSDDLNLGPT